MMIGAYARMWSLALIACQQKVPKDPAGKRHLVVTGVGGANFGLLLWERLDRKGYNGNPVGSEKWFKKNVLDPAVVEAQRVYETVNGKDDPIELIDRGENGPRIPTHPADHADPRADHADPRDHADHIMYVNAWDPWSMAGNGNSQDNSLDGCWGRSSAIAVHAWPLTNPEIKLMPVTFSNNDARGAGTAGAHAGTAATKKQLKQLRASFIRQRFGLPLTHLSAGKLSGYTPLTDEEKEGLQTGLPTE